MTQAIDVTSFTTHIKILSFLNNEWLNIFSLGALEVYDFHIPEQI